MKYMKLGTKADIFRSDGNITSVATDLPSDVTIRCTNYKFCLHKFPLLCRSSKLQKLIAQARDMDLDEVDMDEFPGGVEALAICMKFCYGVEITLNAHDVVAVRTGAEFLEMTEAMEKGNLIYKLEMFLNTSICRSWKDSIIVLQSCKNLMPWSEDLKVIARCVESISSKTTVEPMKVDWSFTYTRPAAYLEHSSTLDPSASPPWNGIHSRHHRNVPRDWWVEDICQLEIDMYWRVMVAIKAKRAAEDLVGEALRVYASKWLPGFSTEEGGIGQGRLTSSLECDTTLDVAGKHRMLLETLINLLPTGKGMSCVSFLLKLLRAASNLSAAAPSKMELARRIGLQLEEAPLEDLLIPSLSYESDMLYDVELVQHILEHFLMQDQSPPTSPSSRVRMPNEGARRTQSAENIDLIGSIRSTSATHSAKLKVAKLVDGYLAEVGQDPHLPVSKFCELAEAVPEFARPLHDALYRGIDVYLKEHPGLSKSDKKRICRLMDCKKLSMDACIHAAQNERLPLRVVVQVLFFEQVRTAMTGGLILQDLPSNIKALLPPSQLQTTEGTPSVGDTSSQEEAWQSVHQNFNALKGDLAVMKKRIADAERDRSSTQHQDEERRPPSQQSQTQTQQQQQHQRQQSVKHKAIFPFPSMSKRFLRKFFYHPRSKGPGPPDASRSSETSPIGSEESSTLSSNPPGRIPSQRQRHIVK